MSSIDQKTYLLNKYLKGPSKDKKKKKRKIRGKGLCIIDDDIDTSKLQHLSDDEIEALGLDGEDAPQIAGIVDERPDHIKEMERFNANKWRVISENDGTGSTLRVEQIHQDGKKLKKEESLIFGKMYSDSEDEQKNDPDVTLRITSTNGERDFNSSKGKSNKNSSPSRHRKKSLSPSDQSRLLKRHEKSELEDKAPASRRNHSTYSDLSTARKSHSSSKHKFSSKREHSSEDDSDFSSSRQSRKDQCKSLKSGARSRKNIKGSDSDLSPLRKSNSLKDHHKSTRDDDSDLSPPRKSKQQEGKLSSSQDKKSNDDSDLSPPRKSSHKDNFRSRRDPSSDSDLSPPRKKESKSKKVKKPSRWGYFESEKSKNSDSDLSPPRNNGREMSKLPAKHSKTQEKREELDRIYRRRNGDSPPPTTKKMEKTLEGKKAGLQSARGMRDEAAELRQREDELYDKMAPELSGRTATAVNRRLGKRESSAEREKNREREARQKEMDEKYTVWNRGLKQVSDERQRQADFLHEASKPLARTRDDADLERALKAVERDGDPMLEYLRSKTKDQTPQRPTYKGSFPPNRFNIRPGYRWDGVDRSNGYEKKLFDSRSRATALQEEAYKWSTEDL